MSYAKYPLVDNPYVKCPQQLFIICSCCMKGMPTRKETPPKRKEHGSNYGRILQHFKTRWSLKDTEAILKELRKLFFSVVEYRYIAAFVRGSKVPLVASGRNLKICMMSYMMGLMVFGGRHFLKKSGHQNRWPLQCYDKVVADC